jgi:hypothetical protein
MKYLQSNLETLKRLDGLDLSNEIINCLVTSLKRVDDEVSSTYDSVIIRNLSFN